MSPRVSYVLSYFVKKGPIYIPLVGLCLLITFLLAVRGTVIAPCRPTGIIGLLLGRSSGCNERQFPIIFQGNIVLWPSPVLVVGL